MSNESASPIAQLPPVCKAKIWSQLALFVASGSSKNIPHRLWSRCFEFLSYGDLRRTAQCCVVFAYAAYNTDGGAYISARLWIGGLQQATPVPSLTFVAGLPAQLKKDDEAPSFADRDAARKRRKQENLAQISEAAPQVTQETDSDMGQPRFGDIGAEGAPQQTPEPTAFIESFRANCGDLNGRAITALAMLPSPKQIMVATATGDVLPLCADTDKPVSGTPAGVPPPLRFRCPGYWRGLHRGAITSADAAHGLIVTGGEDGYIKMWATQNDYFSLRESTSEDTENTFMSPTDAMQPGRPSQLTLPSRNTSLLLAHNKVLSSVKLSCRAVFCTWRWRTGGRRALFDLHDPLAAGHLTAIDAESKSVIFTTEAHRGEACALALCDASDGGITAWTGGQDGEVKAWDMRTPSRVSSVLTCAGKAGPRWACSIVDLCRGGEHLPWRVIAGTDDGRITCYDSRKAGDVEWTLEIPNSNALRISRHVKVAAINVNGPYLAAASHSCGPPHRPTQSQLSFWDISTGRSAPKEAATLPLPESGKPNAMRWHGRCLAMAKWTLPSDSSSHLSIMDLSRAANPVIRWEDY